jgi:hypothetical protein
MGERVTLRWTGAHSGEYSSIRDRYTTESGEIEPEKSDVPCTIYALSGRDVQYGTWGEAETGDLIVGIAPEIDTSSMEDLHVIYAGNVYQVMPNSKVPGTLAGGVVGGKPIFNALHCRYVGEEKWPDQP